MEKVFNIKIFKTLLASLVLSLCVVMAAFSTIACAVGPLTKKSDESLSPLKELTLEKQIASLIKKEFGRDDLDVEVTLAPKKLVLKLDVNSIESIKLHLFNGEKQKCRVTIHSNPPKKSVILAQYSFSKIIPVLAKNLKPGEVITMENIVLQKCSAPFADWSGNSLVQNKERILGKHSSLRLKAKTPIYIDPFSSISTMPD